MVYKRDYIYEQIGGLNDQETETENEALDFITEKAQRMLDIMHDNTGTPDDLRELGDLLDEMDEMDAGSLRQVFWNIMRNASTYLIEHDIEPNVVVL